MSKIFIVCPLVLVALCACEQKSHSLKSHGLAMSPFTSEHFSLLIPRDAEITKKTPVEDFDIYEVTYKGSRILNAYVGNQPSFHSSSDVASLTAEQEEDRTQRGYRTQSARTQSADGRVSRQVLFDLSRQKRDWPQFIHFWYSELSPDMAIISDEIIASTAIAERKDAEEAEAENGSSPRGT